jgi:cell filamentation protein
MFDPFKDCATQGYLRNRFREKDVRIIKQIEHEVFVRNAPKAQQHLAGRDELSYADFLTVHRILFSEFYPWAGQDRAATMPDSAVKKGAVLFAHPHSAKFAVEQGLRLGQAHETMNSKPGEVMGLFAYGHPFLDGNGRTMLLVHMELSHRAGFSIGWDGTNKMDYLHALGQEIESPGRGILDTYLLQFKGPQLDRGAWGESLAVIKGLDGLDVSNQVDGDLADPAVAEKYRRFEERRGYAKTETPKMSDVRRCAK